MGESDKRMSRRGRQEEFSFFSEETLQDCGRHLLQVLFSFRNRTNFVELRGFKSNGFLLTTERRRNEKDCRRNRSVEEYGETACAIFSRQVPARIWESRQIRTADIWTGSDWLGAALAGGPFGYLLVVLILRRNLPEHSGTAGFGRSVEGNVFVLLYIYILLILFGVHGWYLKTHTGRIN